jgi:flagellar assembly protein FliH
MGSHGSPAPARWRPAAASAPVAVHLNRAVADPALAIEAGPTLEEQLAAAYEQGAADAQTRVEEALADERHRLGETIREISALRRKVLDAADHDLMQLAVGMARRILHREVQLDPDVLLAMAHVAIGRLGDRAVVSVHLHPADLAVMSTSGSSREALTLVADLDVPRGGCRLSSEHGEIDLGIDAQMTELARGLLGERADRQHANLH